MCLYRVIHGLDAQDKKKPHEALKRLQRIKVAMADPEVAGLPWYRFPVNEPCLRWNTTSCWTSNYTLHMNTHDMTGIWYDLFDLYNIILYIYLIYLYLYIKYTRYNKYMCMMLWIDLREWGIVLVWIRWMMNWWTLTSLMCACLSSAALLTPNLWHKVVCVKFLDMPYVDFNLIV